MFNLKSISRILLTQSKTLTLSCISSVLIAVVLIISMLNLTLNAETSYENKIRKDYGDIDAIATYASYNGISNSTIDQIENSQGIDQISAGYFDADFMIDDFFVYLVGSDNNKLMKSRYHYRSDILKNEVAVNAVLADCLKCKVNDNVMIGGACFRVKEILEDVSGSAAKLAMAILNRDALAQIFGKTPDNNFILISIKDNYKMDYITKSIWRIDGRLELNATQADELYRDSIESFSIFIKALAICVIIVTGLFVASTMKRFIYKYSRDMAIVRAVGGSKKQVVIIFRYLIININIFGCFGGFLISVLLNKVLLSLINKKLQLFEGDISFYFFESLCAVVFIFIVITLILMISIRKSFKILPLQAFLENEFNQIGRSNKMSKMKALYQVDRVLGKDTYITIKSMFSRLKENLLLTGTIIIIVVISFIGGGLSSILQKNNDEYLKQEYPTDIVATSSNPILYKYMAEYYKQLNNTLGIKASITLSPPGNAFLQNGDLRFLSADFTSMQKQGILGDMTEETNRVILSEEFAEKFSYSVGDYIDVLTPYQYSYDSTGLVVGKTKEQYDVHMLVTGILPNKTLQYYDAFIDINCDNFNIENYVFNRIYISGDLNLADQILRQFKNIYTGVKWSNYEEVKNLSHKALRERYIMFEVVVCILILIAGFGWINAIRHTIVSRTNEYKILRMHGMTIRRLRKMLFLHILIYLLMGIILGVGIGVAVMMLLTYCEGGTGIVVINFNILVLVTYFLVILNALLIPDVLKISKTEIVMGE